VPEEIDNKKSILNSVKLGLDIIPENDEYDQVVMMHINSVIAKLDQLGVDQFGPFEVEDETAKWSDFLGEDKLLNMVKSYVVLQVRLLFDPPTTSFLLDAFNKMSQEMEWRINVQTEGKRVLSD
jgi:hypothetical protein